MKNRSDAISVRVSSEAKAELQRIADAERRTLSQLVAIIIDDFLKERAELRDSPIEFAGVTQMQSSFGVVDIFKFLEEFSQGWIESLVFWTVISGIAIRELPDRTAIICF